MKIKMFVNQFLAFSRKECYHILRDRKTLLILLALPLAQLLIFGFALNSDLVETPVAVMDLSGDAVTNRIIRDFDASTSFNVVRRVSEREEIDRDFRRGHIKVALVFKPGFEQELRHTGRVTMQFIVDASLLSDATTLTHYGQAILMKYQQEKMQDARIPFVILPEVKMMYNPQQKSAYTFVPGVIGIVLMLACALMASVSLVKEKESGTMEVLLVSPVHPSVIIISKVVPYLFVGMLDTILILLVAVFVLQVPILGNVFLLFGMACLFTLASLALGILVSVLTTTQKNAVIVSIAGLMLPAILLSGFLFPLEGMSEAMRWVTRMIPATWFITAAKSIMIKGLGIASVYQEMLVLAGMTVFLLALSVKSLKKRLQ